MVVATALLHDSEELFMAVGRNYAHLSFGVTVQLAERTGAKGTSETETKFSQSAACAIHMVAFRMEQCDIFNLFPNRNF